MKLLPLASSWSAIQHYEMGGKERASFIAFTGVYGRRPPPDLMTVIGAIAALTDQGQIPVNVGAIALARSSYNYRPALEIVGLVAHKDHVQEVTSWLIEQARHVCLAAGYAYLFRKPAEVTGVELIGNFAHLLPESPKAFKASNAVDV